MIRSVELDGSVLGRADGWIRLIIVEVSELCVDGMYFFVSGGNACTSKACRPCFPKLFGACSVQFLPEVRIPWAVSCYMKKGFVYVLV